MPTPPPTSGPPPSVPAAVLMFVLLAFSVASGLAALLVISDQRPLRVGLAVLRVLPLAYAAWMLARRRAPAGQLGWVFVIAYAAHGTLIPWSDVALSLDRGEAPGGWTLLGAVLFPMLWLGALWARRRFPSAF